MHKCPKDNFDPRARWFEVGAAGGGNGSRWALGLYNFFFIMVV